MFFFLVVAAFIFSGPALSQTADGSCVAAPELEVVHSNVVAVDTVADLYHAVNTVPEDTTIVIEPGRYQLEGPVSITTDNLTIRGLETLCNKVLLIGNGMDNENHNGVTSGFWIRAKNTTIANMTIGEIYNHPIQLNGNAYGPRIYNVRMFNAGQQFIKSNPKSRGKGVDNGVVEYSVMEYTDGPPETDHDGAGIGYTNGVDVHGGNGWLIRNNKFLNFHTPDDSDHLWNAAVLMWRGSRDTVTENNLFFNVDRAIAYGLTDWGGDHRGGVVRNNLVVMSPGLYSMTRRWKADAAILVWDSPGTVVLHNTVVTNGNTPFSIESRFDSEDVVFQNNLTDAPIVSSSGALKRMACKYSNLCDEFSQAFKDQNEIAAKAAWFVNPDTGDLRLHEKARRLVRPVRSHPDAKMDFTGRERQEEATPGAFQVP